jgi:Flp pilus assembly protein TadG
MRSERGTAMLETALVLPLLMLVAVGIFDFGRAYQTWQVLTNAAREGARVAVLPNATPAQVQARVAAYMQAGQLGNAATATVAVNQAATVSLGASGTATASLVTVNYPYSFMVLGPIANMIQGGPSIGAPFTMVASAEMRNEAQ